MKREMKDLSDIVDTFKACYDKKVPRFTVVLYSPVMIQLTTLDAVGCEYGFSISDSEINREKDYVILQFVNTFI